MYCRSSGLLSLYSVRVGLHSLRPAYSSTVPIVCGWDMCTDPSRLY